MQGNRVIRIGREEFIEGIRPLEERFDLRLSSTLTDGTVGPGENIVKAAMFPQPEILFTFRTAPKDDPEVFVLKEPPEPERPLLLVGVRPCDARSIHLNSMAYEEDSYFTRRMEQSLVFGLLCREMLKTCFCRKVGTGPLDFRHMDIAMMEDETGRLLVFPTSKKGEDFFEEVLLAVLGRAEKEDVAKTSFQGEVFNEKYDDTVLADLLSRDLMGLYGAEFWSTIKDACLNCGICTFRCPTCYCFDIQDETQGIKGRRIRYWDSCMFPLFTLHASGHNPRGQKVARVRNRFMHKFKYFPDRFRAISCVGCGRCIRECPVNIDVREVMELMIGV